MYIYYNSGDHANYFKIFVIQNKRNPLILSYYVSLRVRFSALNEIISKLELSIMIYTPTFLRFAFFKVSRIEM